MDNFFQNERNKNTNLAALTKVATEVHYLSRVFFCFYLVRGLILNIIKYFIVHCAISVYASLNRNYLMLWWQSKVSLCKKFICMLRTHYLGIDYITVFVCFTELALACGHFSTSLHLCVNQDDAAAVAFSKLEFTK